MKEIQYGNLDFLQPQNAWEALSQKEKADVMKVAVRRGITDLATIRQMYNEFAEGGDTTPVEYAHQRFPVTQEFDVHSYKDENFTPEGMGNIEYMSAAHDSLPYYNNYQKPDSLKGKAAVVYNDRMGDATNEAVALDILSHGLREQDPTWRKKYLPTLHDAFEGDAIYNMTDRDKAVYNLNDPEERGEVIDNYIDGYIRTMAVDDKYRKALNYASRKEFNREYNQLPPEQQNALAEAYSYIHPTQLPEITVTGNKHSDGGNLFGGGSYMDKAKALIKSNEGWAKMPYIDAPIGEDGKPITNWRSVGYGFNDSGFRDKYPDGISNHYKNGITKAQAEEELNWYLNRADSHLRKMYGSKWDTFTDGQKAAILDTYYQRPASVAKGSVFYGNVMSGKGSMTPGVAGYSERNKKRKKAFLGLDTEPYSVPAALQPAQDNTFVFNPYTLQQQATLPYPEVVSTPTTLPTFPSEVELEYQRKQQEAAENRYRFNMAMNVLKLLNGEQDPAESFLQNFMPNPSIPLFNGLPEDQYAKGGRIHIKPSHRGRLTELKKRTGKSASWYKAHGTPEQRKMATFELNARKWKHADGGPLYGPVVEAAKNLFYPGGNITLGPRYYMYDKNGQIMRYPDGTPMIQVNASAFPEVTIIPDSQKSPADRNEDERFRARTQKDYDEHKQNEWTAQQANSWRKSYNQSGAKKVEDFFKGEQKDEWKKPTYFSAFDSSLKPYGELFGALAHGLQPLSPSQHVGAATDAIQGKRGYFDSLFNGNNGFFSDQWAAEHPLVSLYGNMVGDAGVGIGAVKTLPAVQKAASAASEGAEKALTLFNSPLTGNWTKFGSNEYRLSPNSFGSTGLPLESRTLNPIGETVIPDVQEINISPEELYKTLQNQEGYYFLGHGTGRNSNVSPETIFNSGLRVKGGDATNTTIPISESNLASWPHLNSKEIIILPGKVDMVKYDSPFGRIATDWYSNKVFDWDDNPGTIGKGLMAVNKPHASFVFDENMAVHTKPEAILGSYNTNTHTLKLNPSSQYKFQFGETSNTPQITAENAASIAPEQWTAAQDAAIASGDMAEAQRLRNLHLDAKIPSTQVTDLRDLKSADAVTYNPETGERIPLGARDDFSNPDIRYSLESDLKGKPAALSAGKVIRKADSDVREMNRYHQANVDAYNEATGSNVQSIPFRTDYTGRRVQVLPNEEFNAKMAEFNVNAPSGTAENIGGVYSKRNDTVYLRSTGNPSNNYHEFLHSARYGETNPEVTRWRISQLVDEDKVANMSPKENAYYLSEMEAPTHLRQQGEKFNIEIGQEYPGDEAFDELWNSGVGGASYYMKHSTPEEKRLLWKGWNGTLFGLTAPTVITAAVAANSQALGGPIVQDALKHRYDGISEKTQKMQKASPYRYVLGEDGKWNMVDNDEMARVFQGFTVTPNGSKKKFIPEKIDNSMEAAVRRDKFLQNRNENGTLIGEPGLELVHPEFDAIALAPLAGMAGKYAANKISTAAANYAAEHPGIYQYPRYAIGKFKYGFDAELPTLYRKVKGIPAVENGRLQVSNPNNRFAFDNGYGEESPLLTNFTTDAPVRSHGAGNWDRGLTLSFPGKTLLGKKVVSTRPSDTFIIGDNITVPTKNVQAFTGRPKEIQFLNDNGIKVTTSPDAQMFFESGVDDYMAKAAKYRADRQKILQMKAEGKGPVLLRPKAPLDNFTNYAREIEDLTREAHKAPTAKDYAFMDYVFRPQFTSQTMPVVDDLTVEAAKNFPLLGEWAGNVERLRYLDDFSRWRNVMYDPLTGAEADFRRSLNIGLKPLFKK